MPWDVIETLTRTLAIPEPDGTILLDLDPENRLSGHLLDVHVGVPGDLFQPLLDHNGFFLEDFQVIPEKLYR